MKTTVNFSNNSNYCAVEKVRLTKERKREKKKKVLAVEEQSPENFDTFTPIRILMLDPPSRAARLHKLWQIFPHFFETLQSHAFLTPTPLLQL